MQSVQSSEMLEEYLLPIQKFIDDASLTEICINRPGELWTEGRDSWVRYVVDQLSFSHCRQLATLIASYNGKSISTDKPVLSAALPKGERVQVLIPPACEAGTVSITIRKPSLLDKTLDELDAEGAFQQVDAIQEGLKPFEHELLHLKSKGKIKDFLELGVRSHRNILIAGKTGSGKTTVTKSLIRSIPTHERLITIEDVHELFLNQHPNKVHLFYARDDEGGAKVTPKQALASCLRMKPDRILLAELRGDEAWEFIKSVNTGHPGSITTMHANGAFESFEQLTALIKDSRTGAHLDANYIKQRLFTTLDIVLFYHQRRLREIYYDPEVRLQYLSQSKNNYSSKGNEKKSDLDDGGVVKNPEIRYQMAAAYIQAVNSVDKTRAQSVAIAKFHELLPVFSVRDAILSQVNYLPHSDIFVDSIDSKAVKAIMEDKISSLKISLLQQEASVGRSGDYTREVAA